MIQITLHIGNKLSGTTFHTGKSNRGIKDSNQSVYRNLALKEAIQPVAMHLSFNKLQILN